MVVNPKGEVLYYVTTLSDFRLKFRYGAKAETLKDVQDLVNHQLATDKFIGKINPKPLPLTKPQVQFSNEAVEKQDIYYTKI